MSCFGIALLSTALQQGLDRTTCATNNSSSSTNRVHSTVLLKCRELQATVMQVSISKLL